MDAAISADGHTVTFASQAGNLVAGDANGAADVFRAPASLAHYGHVTPIFSGQVGGPVEVRTCSQPFSPSGSCPGATLQVMASQRVLWNGYFNEVLGTVTG
ncbi:MAG: hypothetical protein ACYDGX_06705 [Thermoleophilia bacterium]